MSDSTKTRILRAAGPIFARKGFSKSTAREICDAAGVNLASINYYFGDKSRLYLETVVYARNMRADQIPEPDWSSWETAEEKLRAYVALLLNRIAVFGTPPWQVQLLLREILQPTDACQQLVQEYFRPFLDVLISIIDELSQVALKRSDKMQLAFSIIGQCMYYCFASELTQMIVEEENLSSAFQIENLTNHITKYSLAAIENYCDEHFNSAAKKQ